MNLSEALENFFYYGFIVWFIFVVYLALGNGIMPLAFVEIAHPYQAMFHLPDWVVISGLLFFFIFASVTTENEEHEKILAFLFLVGAIIGVISTVGAAVVFPSIWTNLSVVGAGVILAGSVLNLWWKWRETVQSMMR